MFRDYSDSAHRPISNYNVDVYQVTPDHEWVEGRGTQTILRESKKTNCFIHSYTLYVKLVPHMLVIGLSKVRDVSEALSVDPAVLFRDVRMHEGFDSRFFIPIPAEGILTFVSPETTSHYDTTIDSLQPIDFVSDEGFNQLVWDAK